MINYKSLKHLFICFFLILFSCSKISQNKKTEKNNYLKKESYFISVPITKFSSINSPCLDVSVNDVLYSVELDLGFRGYLTMYQDLVDQITEKKEAGHRKMYGIRGKEYLNTVYDLEKIKIGDISFLNITLQGEERTFTEDSILQKGDEEAIFRAPGRVGWCLFQNSNLLVDIQGKKLIFCDSLENLQQHGYFQGKWTEVPMLLDQGMVECKANVPQRTLRCMFDTGATVNMLHLEGTQTIDEAIQDPQNIVTYPCFHIGNQDTGEISFISLPIRLPVPIQAILGMEFFSKHNVFLDFANERIILETGSE